ncbi:MAG: helix-turn-helix domain-containing protein, partial [Rhodovarius sp.]|nr:helix-turn-helix domain-containing protein [Rhodovarius sp.]
MQVFCTDVPVEVRAHMAPAGSVPMGISPGVKTGEESAEPAAGVAASAIDRAIEAAGGLEAFRKLLGVSRRTVFHWKQHGVPAERAPEIEAATG